MAWADLVRRVWKPRGIVRLDRKRVGLWLVGLRQAGQCGHLGRKA